MALLFCRGVGKKRALYGGKGASFPGKGDPMHCPVIEGKGGAYIPWLNESISKQGASEALYFLEKGRNKLVRLKGNPGNREKANFFRGKKGRTRTDQKRKKDHFILLLEENDPFYEIKLEEKGGKWSREMRGGWIFKGGGVRLLHFFGKKEQSLDMERYF